MKREILEATDENILNTIKNNTFNRNDDVKEFVETLDLIEGNMFISLDAKWGEGKTFYVRQIEKTLDFISKRTWDGDMEVDKMKPYFQNTSLDLIELKRSYLPIYYDAWLYDNHDDPLMSLMFIIAKQSNKLIKTKLSSSISSKMLNLISSASVSISNTSLSVEGEKIKSSLTGVDILETIKTAEEIRELVKEILDDVITETAEKLVIFVDELDRCKPSFAIEMLERIKHYFDDERIIFIVSINKEQLVHTITKYYGQNFDSTGYLNKFFDLNIHMPTFSIKNQSNSIFERFSSRQRWLVRIANELNDYYKLSIRDALLFKQRLSNISQLYVNDDSTQGYYLSLFIPIILILDLKDEEEKIRFINGKSDIIESLSNNVPVINRIICSFGNNGSEYESGLDMVLKIYKNIFGSANEDLWSQWRMEVDPGMREICIKLCNGFY